MVGKKDKYIVGIGASDGGLEAINQFFKAITSNIGMAFVICEHLDSNNKCHLAQILEYHTELKVKNIIDGMCIEENTIYLVPENKEVEIEVDTFKLYDKNTKICILIDRFFHSLGKEKKDKAIGIILSGTGKDGSEGIRTINKEKGLVIVQNEDTAEFIDKPRNAAATGAVDYVLPPSKMIEVILRQTNKENIPVAFLGNREREEAFYRIIGIVKDYIGVDLLSYKKNTISRRIQQRMQTLKIENLKDYLFYLRDNKKEINILYEAICIGVTQFFRDREAFKSLEEKVIPNLFKNRYEDDVVRIWLAGCSTGEEVYSLLILCEEYFERVGKRCKLKIFATDLNEKALNQASKGIYSEESMINISLRRKEKFFNYTSNGYSVSKTLRNHVIFSKHNLIKDIPFSNLDLIICRNLLIYLEGETQQNILSLFHFALNHNGYLFLGNSESIGNMHKYFEDIDLKWKIYKYAGQVRKPRTNIYEARSFTEYQQKNNKKREDSNKIREYNTQQAIDKVLEDLGSMYIPKGVIIDEDYELIHAIGDVNDYIKIPLSRMSLNLFKMIRKDLAIPLGTAVHNVLKEERLCKYKNIRMKEKNGYKDITLNVIPFNNAQIDKKYIVILFEEENTQIEKSNEGDLFTENKVYERIADLESELSFNKEHLKSVIEELELSNEELILSNEELQNINEELQSVNEELYIVNGEYQAKLEEVTHAKESIKNLVNVADLNVIRLDKELCIREFTPSISKLMNLIPSDIGRPLNNIASILDYSNLFRDIQEVLITLKEKEEVAKDYKGLIYKIKIIPHLSGEGLIKGVLISIVDISNVINSLNLLNLLG